MGWDAPRRRQPDDDLRRAEQLHQRPEREAKQDTVFYVNCESGGKQIGGVAYVGLPRIAMHAIGSEYGFSKTFEFHGIRHLGTSSRTQMTVTLSISGELSAETINGAVKITAPGCLPHAYTVNYAGS